jgi:hypothetical protein
MCRRDLAVVALALTLALTGCSKSDGQPAANSNQGGGAAGGGAEGFEGSLVTSGKYSATWTVNPEAEADVFNSSNHVTLVSDHQTFANVRVQPDGSISFGSGAPELSSNGSYQGSGAQVTMEHTNRFVCAFTVDTDLTGTTDGAVLHLKGSMKVNWHPEGIGDASCP